MNFITEISLHIAMLRKTYFTHLTGTLTLTLTYGLQPPWSQRYAAFTAIEDCEDA